MIAQIRAELLKIRSTRTTLGLILAMIALILLLTLLTGLLTHLSGLASKEDRRQLLSVGGFAGVFSALAGVLLVTSEYRFGTIRPTILFNPARSYVLAAKVVAGALAVIAFGVLGEAVSWAIGYAILDRRGITVVLGSGDILAAHARRARRRGSVGRDRRRPRRDHPQPSWRRHCAARLGSRRRQPPVRLVPSVGRFMPNCASDALTGLRVHQLVSPGAGAITLIAWACALGVSVSAGPFGRTSTDSLGDRHRVTATPVQ